MLVPHSSSLILLGTLIAVVFLLVLNEYRKYTKNLRRERDYYKTLASVDTLTGVGNRRSLDSRLEEEIDRAIRQKNSLCFALIDVDKFHDVNLRLGHAQADIVLRLLADAIKSSIRKSDHVFRFGGDEFAVVMTNTNITKAQEVAKRIFDAIESDPILFENHISISAGLTEFPNSDFNLVDFRVDHSLLASDTINQASFALLNKAKNGTGIAVHNGT
ncbi:GGDEF domain-containing protein [bacterium]|nr:GGDEF domain-containing protein [bacterium]